MPNRTMLAKLVGWVRADYSPLAPRHGHNPLFALIPATPPEDGILRSQAGPGKAVGDIVAEDEHGPRV